MERARGVLARLEAGKGGRASGLVEELPLFAAGPAEPAQPSALQTALEEMDPDALTPRAALELVYKLKALLAAEEEG